LQQFRHPQRVLILLCIWAVGWAFVISMLAASFFGAAITDDIEEYV
jgi:hypothetical protein